MSSQDQAAGLGSISPPRQSPRLPVLALILTLALVGGALIADDFGASWDEPANDQAGVLAIKAYQSDQFLRDQQDEYLHGTFYFMIYAGLSRALATLPLGLDRFDVRHFLNYLTFLLSIAACYSLVVRLHSRRAAILTAILMLGQPLLFGHAFINQKDIPFMGFFAASVAAGVVAIDAVSLTAGHLPGFGSGAARSLPAALLDSARAAWVDSRLAHRIAFGLIVLAAGGAIAELYAERLIYPALELLLTNATNQQSSGLVNWLFRAMAVDADKTPLAAYVARLQATYSFGRVVAITLISVGVAQAWTRLLRPTLAKQVAAAVRAYGWLLGAGVLLGMTTAIRPIGPLAGALVSVYAVARFKRKMPAVLLLYPLTALGATYLAWPALWGSPVDHFLGRFADTVNFEHSHVVIFEGGRVASLNLPFHYLPKLLAVQFTEPVVILLLMSPYFITRALRAGQLDRGLLSVFALWFALPFTAQIVLRTPLYDNFRQLLFSTVPLLAIAGVTLSSILRAITRKWAKALVVLLVIAPGAVHSIRFHPYEYVYYNALVGGVAGAEGRYELDYWCTAYRELTEHLNEVAPPNSTIVAWGPLSIARADARKDLHVRTTWGNRASADYVMICGDGLYNAALIQGFDVQFEIRRGTVVLGRVASRRPTE